MKGQGCYIYVNKIIQLSSTNLCFRQQCWGVFCVCCFAFSPIVVQNQNFVYLFPFFLRFSDNVHFQQAAQIAKALVDAEVDFQAMVCLCSVYHITNGLIL